MKLILILSLFWGISTVCQEQEPLFTQPPRSGKAFFARVMADQLSNRDQLHDSLAQKPNKKPQSFTAQKIMYGIGATGSAISFAFWLKPTINVIQKLGLAEAIASTYVPRVAIDALLVGACIKGFTNCLKMEELLHQKHTT